MSNMEMQNGIPLEEAMKQAQKALLAHAAEEEQQSKNEKVQLNLQLHVLRSNISLEGMNFHDPETLAYSLSRKDYLAQMITLEKAVQADAISPRKMIELFSATHDNKTRLAIVENLPKLKTADSSQQAECLEFLYRLTTEYFSDPNEIEIGLQMNNPKIFLYLQKYRTDFDENSDYDLFVSAAIDGLSKLGPVAEEELIDIFKHNLRRREDEGVKTSSAAEKDYREVQSKDEYYNLLFEDKKNRIVDREVAGVIHINHAYNERILDGLEKVGSKKSIDFILELIRLDGDVLFMYKILPILEKDQQYSAEKIFPLLNRNQLNEWQFPSLVILLTDLIGAEETRDSLNDLLHKERARKENADQSIIDNLEYARSFITPNHEKIAVESLPDLYENKIKFETYGLNGKMQKREIELLEGLIKKDQRVLEAGIGTGRLFLEFQKAGYDITGFDFTQRHIALVRGEAPEAKVFKGDWKNNALKNESFDVVYSLGRNILHEYSLPDQVQMFREAARVLKKGGRFIFDIPDRDKGEYKDRVDDYAEMMENEFQVRNYRRGAIYDSPNSVDFFTRYAYSNEDIENLAQLAGFRIAEVRREELPTGQGDENLYYVLEKI
jgi:SAM-dependent methyltransferase